MLSMERYAVIDCRNDTELQQICLIFTFPEVHTYALAGSSIGSYTSLHMRAFSHRIQCICGGGVQRQE